MFCRHFQVFCQASGNHAESPEISCNLNIPYSNCKDLSHINLQKSAGLEEVVLLHNLFRNLSCLKKPDKTSFAKRISTPYTYLPINYLI